MHLSLCKLIDHLRGWHLTVKPLLWTPPSNSHFSNSFNSTLILFCQVCSTFLYIVRLPTIFGKSHDQNRKILMHKNSSSLTLNYVFNKFLEEQYENILTNSVAWILKEIIFERKFDVIKPSIDTPSKYQFHFFFVQVKIPYYSLRKMMGRFPHSEKNASFLVS